MAKKKPAVHGIAKAQQINAKRSTHAKRTDAAKASRHQYKKATPANIKKWSKNPGKSDMKSVDTKRKPKKKSKSKKK